MSNPPSAHRPVPGLYSATRAKQADHLNRILIVGTSGSGKTTLGRALARDLDGNLILDQELWNGNRQTFRRAFWGRDSLLAWTIRTHRRLRATIPDRVRSAPNQPRLVRLRTPGEARTWYRRQTETP